MKSEHKVYNNDREIQFYIDDERAIANRRLNLSL